MSPVKRNRPHTGAQDAAGEPGAAQGAPASPARGRSAKSAGPVESAGPGGPARPGGKGRPTPRRKAAEARGLRPVVPTDRKAAKREAREARQDAIRRQQEAMRTGEDRYLPARDKGPIKRYIRDYVDARFRIGELFMPLALILLVLSFAASYMAQTSALYAMVAIYAVLFLAIGDCALCWWQVRRRLHAKFGRERVREQGIIFFYIFSRCMQPRRLRQPAAQVARREYPS